MRNPANNQTIQPTDRGKNKTSLVEVLKELHHVVEKKSKIQHCPGFSMTH